MRSESPGLVEAHCIVKAPPGFGHCLRLVQTDKCVVPGKVLETCLRRAPDVLQGCSPQQPCQNVAFPIGFCTPPPPDLPLGGFATLSSLILWDGRCPNSAVRPAHAPISLAGRLAQKCSGPVPGIGLAAFSPYGSAGTFFN